MKDQLISFDVAKLAKEKGFKEYCIAYFSISGEEIYFREDGMYFHSNRPNGRLILRPTQSLLQKWLRKEHSIYIDIKTDTTPNEILGFEVRLKSYKFSPHYIDFFNSYEEAIENGLMSALEMIK